MLELTTANPSLQEQETQPLSAGNDFACQTILGSNYVSGGEKGCLFASENETLQG